MDFGDSPAEAEFRGQARAWLEANAPRKSAEVESVGGPVDRSFRRGAR